MVELDPGVKVRRRISFESANLIGSPQNDGKERRMKAADKRSDRLPEKGTGPEVKTRASGKRFEMNCN